MAEGVTVDIEGAVAVITLNRPERRNAIDAAMTHALSAAITEVEADPEVRAVVLTGAGPVFCAGMDLAAFQAGEGEAILFGADGFAGFVRRARRKPVIAAVEGAALAGGFEMMLACDLAVAGQGAMFGVPEVKLGLVAGGGGAIRLRDRMPRVLANEMLLTGRSYPAEAMKDWGLLNAVVPDGEALAAAGALAEEIAANAPLATAATRDLAALTDADAAAVWRANDDQLRRLGETADLREGITAFLEKRAPIWRGR